MSSVYRAGVMMGVPAGQGRRSHLGLRSALCEVRHHGPPESATAASRFAYSDFSATPWISCPERSTICLRVASSRPEAHRWTATCAAVRDLIIEAVARTASVVDQWRLCDILDPYRECRASRALDQGAVCLNLDANASPVTTATPRRNCSRPGQGRTAAATSPALGPGRNWAHVNSVDYDPTDDSIIISSRHQSAVVKIGRDHEGEVDSGRRRRLAGSPESANLHAHPGRRERRESPDVRWAAPATTRTSTGPSPSTPPSVSIRDVR